MKLIGMMMIPTKVHHTKRICVVALRCYLFNWYQSIGLDVGLGLFAFSRSRHLSSMPSTLAVYIHKCQLEALWVSRRGVCLHADCNELRIALSTACILIGLFRT